MFNMNVFTRRLSRLSFTHSKYSLRRMSTAIQPTNQHFSVDPDGKQVYDLSFKSEALGMPASAGYGWANLKCGQKFGPKEQYTIERKLGWGVHSSTWLARDNVANNFVAIKVLTGYITDLDKKNMVWEANALRALTYGMSPHVIHLFTDFVVPGKDQEEGDHLCLVTPVYAGDIDSLYRANGKKPFPLNLSKRILLHVLRGLSYVHERGVIHADLKLDNIFFNMDPPLTTQDIEHFLAQNPPRHHDPEISHEGMIIQSVVSQPFPLISMEQASNATFVLGDFGCAQPSRLHDRRLMNIVPYRPPEVWLQGEWDKPADIWAFGCLIFELVTGRPLFHYVKNDYYGMSEIQHMLYQMTCKTGDYFMAHLLSQWPGAVEYFNPHNCSFKSEKEVIIYDLPFEDCIAAESESANLSLDEKEQKLMADLMRRCLRIDPEHRVSAEQLLDDPWFLDI